MESIWLTEMLNWGCCAGPAFVVGPHPENRSLRQTRLATCVCVVVNSPAEFLGGAKNATIEHRDAANNLIRALTHVRFVARSQFDTL